MKEKFKKIIIPLVILILIVFGFFFKKEEENQETINNDIPVPISDIIIEIKGEVKYPGLYQISSTARVYEVINIAGGFTADADYSVLNLAEKVKDGSVIHIASRKKSENKISLNYASLEELMTLKGIGEVKARSIIDYREAVGRFRSLDELKNVQGISENLFEQIKEQLIL